MNKAHKKKIGSKPNSIIKTLEISTLLNTNANNKIVKKNFNKPFIYYSDLNN